MSHRKRGGRRLNGLDRKLLAGLEKEYSRGAMVLVGTNDLVGRAIRAGQRELTADGEPSRWSHSFLFGDRRLTLTPGGRQARPAAYIFESDLQVDLEHARVRNGAQENWLGKWCLKTVEHCAVIDLGLSEEQADRVLATALHLVDRQMQYPVQDLVGTWLAIIRSKLWQSNPLKSRNAMYCSAYARHCYRAADADFVSRRVSLSNTAPEHLARAAEKRGRLKIIR